MLNEDYRFAEKDTARAKERVYQTGVSNDRTGVSSRPTGVSNYRTGVSGRPTGVSNDRIGVSSRPTGVYILSCFHFRLTNE